MKICLVSTEVLGWGVAGGYGFATRSLGRELAAQGLEVTAVIPQPRNTDEGEMWLDGIRVLTYPRLAARQGVALLSRTDADVYHSQEPSLGTWLAQIARPERLHLVTSRDPRTMADWLVELRHPTYNAGQVLRTIAYYENYVTRRGVRGARRVYVPAHFLIERVRRKYRLREAPRFLPTPVRLPTTVTKASEPTVCYVGRLDRRKRPERLVALARQFPHVRFLVAGTAQDPRFAAELDARFGGLPNLELRGFVNQFDGDGLSRLLEKSWVLVNTSAREGLPNSFIEACGHGCAILSPVDPDGFASRFGRWVPDDDFASGLGDLLAGDIWRRRGEAGRRYALETNEAGAAARLHLREYESLL